MDVDELSTSHVDDDDQIRRMLRQDWAKENHQHKMGEREREKERERERERDGGGGKAREV